MRPHPAPGGILGGPVDGPARLAASFPAAEAAPGLLVLHRAKGFAGQIVRFDGDEVVLRGSTGLERTFRVRPGDFAVDGRAVRLVPPFDAADDALRGGVVRNDVRTASGSRKVDGARARVARASRILVEGMHDAELIEKVWGDDLRIEGVVVEPIGGIDHLGDVIEALDPGPQRRLGVLVDHLVAGSKEAKVAASVRHEHVLVAGTPFVDVWAAIRPEAAGIDDWPTVPMGIPWKEGVCRALGVDDPPAFWRTLLGRVGDWGDLDRSLVGAVEQLIDFVTAAGGDQ